MKAWVMKPAALAALTASSSAAGYDVGHAANDHAGIVWKSVPGGASAWMIADLGSAQAIDAALFFGCSGAQPGWTLKVESADDAAFAVNAAVLANAIPFLAGTEMPTHGRGVGYWEAAAAPTPRRYWRFTIGGLADASAVVARLVIGTKLQLERNFAFGGGWGVRDLGTVEFSAQGVRMRRRAPKMRTLGLAFPAVTKDEVEAKVQPLLEQVGGQEMVAIVTDPEPDAMRQRRCWFGNLFGDLGTVWRTAAAWEWRANLIDFIPLPSEGAASLGVGAGVGDPPPTAAARALDRSLDRAALIAIAGPEPKLARYLTEAGREGLFVFDSSNLSTLVAADPSQGIYIAPATDPSGASGAWVRQIDGPVRPEWFGAVSDSTPAGATGTNNSAAMAGLLASQKVLENRNPSAFYKGGREILFDGDTYYMGVAPIPFKVGVRVRAMGLGSPGGEPTIHRWGPSTAGFVVERFDTLNGGEETPVSTGGDGTRFDGILAQGGGGADNVVNAAFRFRGRGGAVNCIARKWSGPGFLLSADTSVPASDPFHGNCNNSLIFNCRAEDCLDGSYNSGGDGSAGLIMLLDATRNRRWGEVDLTFLASTHIANHYDANGFYDATTNTTSIVHFAGRRYQVKYGQDANAGTSQPDISPTVWIDQGVGGASALILTWELNGGAGGVIYRAGGACLINPPGATAVLIGCYYETGQGAPQVINGIVLGGFMGEGLIDGGPHLYANPNFGLTQQRPYTQRRTFNNLATASHMLGGLMSDAMPWLLSTQSSVATPFNPAARAGWKHDLATGDHVWFGATGNGYVRLTNYNTGRTYGGRSQAEARDVLEARFLAVGAGDNARMISSGGSVPGSGYSARGDIILNNLPTASGKIGWATTTSGTLGSTAVTKPFGAIDA